MLEKYANSPQQREVARCADENPQWSSGAIATHLGLGAGAVRKTLYRLRVRQARKDPGVHSNEAPLSYELKGVSTQRRDAEGNVQWVKTRALPTTQDPNVALRAFKGAVKDANIVPAMPVPPPDDCLSELLTVYPLGDAHLGAICDSIVGGGDYDLNSSIADLELSVGELIDRSPASGTALIVDVGDYYHADSLDGTTRRSGHKLDVDPRWEQVFRAGLMVKLRLVERALKKHQHVHIASMRGNHDDHSSFHTQVALEMYYKDEPRVTVAPCESNIYTYQHGAVMIAATHGHAPKADDLESILAADYPMLWGLTTHRHAYTGHIHHRTVKEFRGLTVESLRVHGKRDRWAQSSGYRAQRGIKADTWHLTRGLVSGQNITLP